MGCLKERSSKQAQRRMAPKRLRTPGQEQQRGDAARHGSHVLPLVQTQATQDILFLVGKEAAVEVTRPGLLPFHETAGLGVDGLANSTVQRLEDGVVGGPGGGAAAGVGP